MVEEGEVPAVCTTEIQEFPVINALNFPTQVRIQIWNKLNSGDHARLRCVSKQVQQEIDNEIGLSVKLIGPPQSNVNWRSNALRLFGMTEEQRKVSWVKKVKVRGLRLGHLSTFPFEPTTLLKEPDTLRKLVIQVEEQNVPPVNELLRLWNNVKVLEINFPNRKPIQDYFLKPDTLEAMNPSNTFQQLLPSLVSMKNLLKLRLTEDLEPCVQDRCFRLIGMPEVSCDSPSPEYPTNIRVLQIHQPFMRKDLLPGWKSLMDAQINLNTLEVNFGFIYWEFFAAALRKNDMSLRNLSLLFVNSCPPDDTQLHRSGTPQCSDHMERDENRWFDWKLAPDSLETLRISMSESILGHLIPFGTRNFFSLNMDYLRVLELNYVKLSSGDLGRIFQAPHLRQIGLKAWTHEDGHELGGRAVEICQLVVGLLPLIRINRLQFSDNCLDIDYCSSVIRDTVTHPGYAVVWRDKTKLDMHDFRIVEFIPWSSLQISSLAEE